MGYIYSARSYAKRAVFNTSDSRGYTCLICLANHGRCQGSRLVSTRLHQSTEGSVHGSASRWRAESVLTDLHVLRQEFIPPKPVGQRRNWLSSWWLSLSKSCRDIVSAFSIVSVFLIPRTVPPTSRLNQYRPRRRAV